MDVGIPLEVADAERRVALTPAGVRRLARAGHRVFIECSAGKASRFSDEEYHDAGAQLAYDAEELYGRADLLLKVASPSAREYELLRQDQILVCFLRPAVAPERGMRSLLERRVAAIALELIEDEQGNAPVLRAMSEIAGPMSVHIAAHLLESEAGRGILLGGAPGIPPATVVILGAGVVGTTAARTALGNGAQVFVLDREVDRLRVLDQLLDRRAITMLADHYQVSRAVEFADVLIGAVMIRADRTPSVVTDAMVRAMKPGSVVVDVSIDQGGCLESSRPTTILQPTYLYENVVHYAVPNMPSSVARTATYALTNTCLPYVLEIANRGVREACAADPGLRRGLVTADGLCFEETIARRFHIPVNDPQRQRLAER